VILSFAAKESWADAYYAVFAFAFDNWGIFCVAEVGEIDESVFVL
jgi:hypothetical protein